MKRRWAIRVVHSSDKDRAFGPEPHPSSELIESLRYMGIITVYELDPAGPAYLCYDIECPSEIKDSKIWAEENAKRMKTFGFNAEAAPSTKGV